MVYLAEGAKVIDERTVRELADVYQMLADPTRLKIIALLAEREHCVGEIAEALGMSMSAISHQLSLLRRGRLVRWQREGREVRYRLDDEHIEILFQAGLEHVMHGRNG